MRKSKEKFFNQVEVLVENSRSEEAIHVENDKLVENPVIKCVNDAAEGDAFAPDFGLSFA